jgi:AraC-like DNA-binding protein
MDGAHKKKKRAVQFGVWLGGPAMIRTAGVNWSATRATRRNVQPGAAGIATQRHFQQERLNKVLDAIASGEPYSLERLATEFNLSKSHLQHFFKQQTGLRLGHTIIEQRLNRAAQLLKSTNMRIKEIADAVGYEHTSSFIRAFERRFTQPPRAYRLRR